MPDLGLLNVKTRFILLGESTLGLFVRYRHLETALAKVMEVEAKDMGAFRANLRHLRNLGLPQLPSPGSGQAIEYTRKQALELVIALKLEKLGQVPRMAAVNAESIVRQSPYGQHKGKDCYVRIAEDRRGYTIAYGLKGLAESIRSAPDVFFIINVSGSVRSLEAALNSL